MDTQKDVRKMGYLRKQKTMKKKLFVLREETEHGPARLEYYDSEKKFVCSTPKRSIHLHNCFSINAKSDSKHKYSVIMYTKDDCFTVVCESEDERNSWLSAMRELRSDENNSSPSSPMYEHIWPVTVKSKGLGSDKHLSPGQYRLCLTLKELSFIRVNQDHPDLIFQLASIRRCGHNDCFFYLELGRTAVTGSGELWMQVEDSIIAQNMHEVILRFMIESKASADQPQLRPRRHSAASAEKHNKPSSHRHRNTAAIPQRSKTMSAGDYPHPRSPLRRRISESPSKGKSSTSGGLHVRSIPSPQGLSLSVSPVSHDSLRSRADSMESSSSRTPTSYSADESPLEESETSETVNRYSPLPTLEDASDYFELGNSSASVSRTNPLPENENYMLMSGHTVGSPHPGESRREDSGYMDMDVGGVVEDSVDRISVGSADHRQDDGYTEMGFEKKPSISVPKGTVDEYVPMDLSSSLATTDSMPYMDMSGSSSAAASIHSLHELDGDTGYMQMGAGANSRTRSLGEQDEYFEIDQDLHIGVGSHSAHMSTMPRMDRVCSYLMNDDDSAIPPRSMSVGSRQQVLNKALNESYVDMTGNKKLAPTPDKYNSKTCSAPLLVHASGSPSPGSSRPGSSLATRVSHNPSKSESKSSKSSKSSSKETLEKQDFLMELDFNKGKRGVPRKDHDYEEIRPRSSSGGSQDMSRRRTGSFGYREKLSKLASMARATVLEYRNSENGGHRPRIATISQDTFHSRTQSFGSVSSDMRPRSSSYGTAGYMDMTGRKLWKKPSSHESSQESLPRGTKRASQESVNSTASDYLDMRPRVSSSPAQALVSMFRKLDSRNRSPQTASDSDYLSMDAGKSGSESSADYASMELPISTSPATVNQSKDKARRGHSKQSSVSSSRGCHSSSESIGSNTSQSSEGHTSDRPRKISSTISEGVATADVTRQGSRASSRNENQPRMGDDSYVPYDPSEVRGTASITISQQLEKVVSPIRADEPSPSLGAAAASASTHQEAKTSKVNDKEYINVAYDQDRQVKSPKSADVRPKQSVNREFIKKNTDSGTRNGKGARFSSVPDTGSGVPSLMLGRPVPRPQPHQTSPSTDGPSRPCPQAPPTNNLAKSTASHSTTPLTDSEPVITQNTASKSKTTAKNDHSSKHTGDHNHQISRPCPKAPSSGAANEEYHTNQASRANVAASSSSKPTLNMKLEKTEENSDYVMVSPPVSRSLSGGSKSAEWDSNTKVSQKDKKQVVKDFKNSSKPAGVTEEPDYIMVSPSVEIKTTGLVTSSSSQNPFQAATFSDYMDFSPGGASKDEKPGGARPRPCLPNMSPSLSVSPPVSLPQTRPQALIEDDYLELALPRPGARSAEGAGSQSSRLVYPSHSSPLQASPPSISQDAESDSQPVSPIKELNYATLDLQTIEESGSTSGEGSAGAVWRPKHASGGSSCGSESPEEGPMQYAQIDFKKSESLRKNSTKKTKAPFDL